MGSGTSLAAWSRAKILVPLEIAGGRADASDVRAAVAVEIGRRASRCRHAAVVEYVLGPTLRVRVFRIIDVYTASLAAVSGDDFGGSIAGEAGSDNGVAVYQRIVDHPPFPGAAMLAVNGNLIPVPWLNRG